MKTNRLKRWTPGSWWIEAETGDVVAKDGDWEICTFSRSDMNHEHDTNLISAAPDLVEALEGLLASIGGGDKQCGHDFTCVCAEDKAKAALAKAYGDQ